MPEDNGRTVAKFVALLLVLAWTLITIGLAFEDVSVVQPPFYGIFTAVVFLLLGKLWDLEVQHLLGQG